jgi:RNA polymerase sigma-70 factor (ECF subfamily)
MVDLAAPAPPDSSPAELASLSAAGNGDAFARLIQRYEGMVYKIVRQHVRGDAADEVAWDAWYRVWRNLRQLRQERGTGSWIARVARSASIDWLRRQDARRRMEEELAQRVDGTEAGPESGLLSAELHAALQRALQDLPEDDRWIVHLSYVAGRTSSQIGETMDMPQSTVKWRLLRSRARLREELVAFA